MKIATDKQVEKWKFKYGNDLTVWFANVRAGEITISDLAKRMGISVEGARKYFYRYYSNEELVGTRYYTTSVKTEDACATVDNNLVDNSFDNQLELRNLIKEVISEELKGIENRLTTMLKTGESTKRDTLKFSATNFATEFNQLMEQLNYISGVVEHTEKLVKQAVGN